MEIMGYTGVDGNCGIHRCRWKDSSKMDLKQVGWENVDWANLAQDRNQWQDVETQ